MKTIEHTIENLVQEGVQPVHASRPYVLFAKWLCVTLLSTGAIISFMVPRPDFQQQWASNLYRIELASLFLMIMTTAITAVWLCYPDLRQKPKMLGLPLLPTVVFLACCVFRLFYPETTLIPPPEKVHGLDCSLCVTEFGIVPGLWMFYLLRRHATIYPVIAGAVSFIASTGIGILVLKVVEPNDSVVHLLTWHMSPMILLAFLGSLFGKKYLSW